MTFEQLPHAEQSIIKTFELMKILLPNDEIEQALDCLDEDLQELETKEMKPKEVLEFMKNFSKEQREALNDWICNNSDSSNLSLFVLLQ